MRPSLAAMGPPIRRPPPHRPLQPAMSSISSSSSSSAASAASLRRPAAASRSGRRLDEPKELEVAVAVAANLMAADDFDSGLATCSDLPSCSEIVCPVKRLPPPTLKQHYYPEGGWGWFIVLIAVVVQTLNHGVQMASGTLLPLILKRFPTATYKSAGKV